MRRRLLVLSGALLLGLAAPTAAQVTALQPPPGANPPVPEPTPVIRLAVTPARAAGQRLEIHPAPRPARLHAGQRRPALDSRGAAASDEGRRLRDSGVKGGPPGTPFNLDNKPVLLKDLPKEEVRAYLAHFAMPLRLADEAARRDHCDWEMPPLTIQDMDFPLEELSHLRMIAGLLTSRCRLELSERRFDDALHTLQTGFAPGA